MKLFLISFVFSIILTYILVILKEGYEVIKEDRKNKSPKKQGKKQK